MIGSGIPKIGPGYGEAVILEKTPFDQRPFLLAGQRDAQAAEAKRKAQEDFQKKVREDTKFKDALWSRMSTGYKDYIVDEALPKLIDPNISEAERAQIRLNVDNYNQTIGAHKEIYGEAEKLLDANKRWYDPSMGREMLDKIMFPKGANTKVQDIQIDVNSIPGMILNNVEAYNVPGLADELMKGAKERGIEYFANEKVPLLGRTFTKDEITGYFFETTTDSSGQVVPVLNDKGLPVVKFTDDFIALMNADRRYAALSNSMKAKGMNDQQIAEQVFANYTGTKRKVTPIADPRPAKEIGGDIGEVVRFEEGGTSTVSNYNLPNGKKGAYSYYSPQAVTVATNTFGKINVTGLVGTSTIDGNLVTSTTAVPMDVLSAGEYRPFYRYKNKEGKIMRMALTNLLAKNGFTMASSEAEQNRQLRSLTGQKIKTQDGLVLTIKPESIEYVLGSTLQYIDKSKLSREILEKVESGEITDYSMIEGDAMNIIFAAHDTNPNLVSKLKTQKKYGKVVGSALDKLPLRKGIGGGSAHTPSKNTFTVLVDGKEYEATQEQVNMMKKDNVNFTIK